MKIFYFSEDLSYPFDEGIKKTARNILQQLLKYHQVAACSKFGKDNNEWNLKNIETNKLLLSSELKKTIQYFKPDTIVYLSSASATFASFLRMKILSSYYTEARTVMINLQPKYLSSLKKRMVSLIKPDVVLTPSVAVESQMKNMGIKTEFFPLYTKLSKFNKKDENTDKNVLRKKYGIPKDKFVITHVGHINYGRNLEALIPLQKSDNQVVVVGSSSTPEDAPKEQALKEKLKKKGMIIIDGYVEDIQEIYKLSDVYIFPVVYEGGCIGVPLTILEARACGTTVLTTDYASVKRVIAKKDPSVIISDCDNFEAEIANIKNKKYPESDGFNAVKKLNEEFLLKLNNVIAG
ncbi:MAG: hypothetical protein CSB55_08680 [Candidatus Cloacimonadota bacterium]|nr:MAG: hypothetical protein CSB55_08680 [Candidatus Cloacimonadota bacterium]